MAKIDRFENLIAWQKARQLMMEIYGATREGIFSKDFSLRDQIRAASSSIMSNIAEGFERGGRPEFHQFLVIAKGSCAEVRSQLYVALDAGYLKETEFLRLQSLAENCQRTSQGGSTPARCKTLNGLCAFSLLTS